TDGHGRTVDFRNTVVIMTSNIGGRHIQELMTEWTVEDQIRKSVMEDLKSFFKPEFLNRVDETIIFHALDRDLLVRIVDIQISQMKRYLKDRHVDLVLTDGTKAFLAETGYDSLYGARPLKRAIQKEILNPLAAKLLEGVFKTGDVIEADMEKNTVVFRKKRAGKKAEAASG
ncbi:MAG: AAA family ATPase, partial [Thermodesulfovibrionia bacterium]|nr:AAA family ATPase [Thermodesulfovibrionia bacterium]